MDDDVVETITGYFCFLKDEDAKYISGANYRCGLAFSVLEQPGIDPDTGMATAVFRGQVFFCPEICPERGETSSGQAPRE